MHFSSLLISVSILLASTGTATGLALPYSSDKSLHRRDSTSFLSNAANDLQNTASHVSGAVNAASVERVLRKAHNWGPNCNLRRCAIALAPSGVGCAVAVVKNYKDLSYVVCLAGLLNALENKPNGCRECNY